MFSTEVHQIQCFWNALLEAGLMADTVDENHKEIIICSRLFQNLSVNHSGFNQSVIDSMFDKGELYLDSLSQILVSLGKLGYSVKLITENSDGRKWDLGNNKKFDDEYFMFKELKSCENISLFWNKSDINESYLQTPNKILRYRFNSTQNEFDKTNKSMFIIAKELHSPEYVEFSEELTKILENSSLYNNKPERMEEIISFPPAMANTLEAISQDSKNIDSELSRTEEESHDIAAKNYSTPQTENDKQHVVYIRCNNYITEYQQSLIAKLSKESVKGITEDEISELLYNDGEPWKPTEASKLKERVEQILSMQVVNENLHNILHTQSIEFIANFKGKVFDLIEDFIRFGQANHIVDRVGFLKDIKDKINNMKNVFDL